jgi:hypothetical protein
LRSAARTRNSSLLRGVRSDWSAMTSSIPMLSSWLSYPTSGLYGFVPVSHGVHFRGTHERRGQAATRGSKTEYCVLPRCV